jgi:hypothetical protein
MNPVGKTIRQIADELGVSKQAVHQKRKSSELSTALRQFTSTVDGVVYISLDGETLLKSAFHSGISINGNSHVDVNEPSTIDGSFTVVDTLVYALKEQLSIKDEQLAAGNRHIDELTARLADVTSALVSTQESLTAAQALHAGTIQAQLTDGRADKSTSSRGFFSRIFGRKGA